MRSNALKKNWASTGSAKSGRESLDRLLRRKAIETLDLQPPEHRLARTLSWPHLVALGVGAIVGTGILTLIGVGADRAGPAVLLSFAVAGAICACAALCYAEMATMIPASGSAYTYSYATLGEVIAWVVGWSLILEYSLVVATVAVGWAGYAIGFLNGARDRDCPTYLTHGPTLAGSLAGHRFISQRRDQPARPSSSSRSSPAC